MTTQVEIVQKTVRNDNEIINLQIDDDSKVYSVDINKPINSDGNLNLWRIWVKNNLPVQLAIFRKIADNWSMIGNSEIVHSTQGLNQWTLSHPIAVQAGDCVGLYYPHNENSGTDKPANVDTGKKPQSVLNFDGKDDYIEIKEPFENNTYFTISLWINPAILNSHFRGFIGKQQDAYRQPGMWVGPSGNELHYDSYDTSGQRYFSILNNFFESKDKWVHIAWVKENTEYKIYRNGELFAIDPAPTNFYTTNTSYWLGRVDNFFQGKMTEVRIWNKARTQDEIKQDMNHRLTGKEEGLMAYYPLNGDASDSSSKNNHGTIHGTTWTQENLEFLAPL